MNKRQYCSRCQYPTSVCICSAVSPFAPSARVIILQHPSETGHAKNTARLIKLCSPSTQIISGEQPEDFAQLRIEIEKFPEDYALVYPSESSDPLEAIPETALPLKYRHLIFIDGTWRKAFKIWKLNPWLQNLTSLHFEEKITGQYQIRKAPGDNQLSTLEAVACLLEKGYQQDASPLFDLFQAWQNVAFARHGSFKQPSD